MWAWGWAAAALLWLQTAGAGARQELKKSRQLFARVDSPNITTSNREGFPGSVKVGRGWGVCRCAASKLRLAPTSTALLSHFQVALPVALIPNPGLALAAARAGTGLWGSLPLPGLVALKRLTL